MYILHLSSCTDLHIHYVYYTSSAALRLYMNLDDMRSSSKRCELVGLHETFGFVFPYTELHVTGDDMSSTTCCCSLSDRQWSINQDMPASTIPTWILEKAARQYELICCLRRSWPIFRPYIASGLKKAVRRFQEVSNTVVDIAFECTKTCLSRPFLAI